MITVVTRELHRLREGWLNPIGADADLADAARAAKSAERPDRGP
jgi:hypothetical protein